MRGTTSSPAQLYVTRLTGRDCRIFGCRPGRPNQRCQRLVRTITWGVVRVGSDGFSLGLDPRDLVTSTSNPGKHVRTPANMFELQQTRSNPGKHVRTSANTFEPRQTCSNKQTQMDCLSTHVAQLPSSALSPKTRSHKPSQILNHCRRRLVTNGLVEG